MSNLETLYEMKDISETVDSLKWNVFRGASHTIKSRTVEEDGILY